MKYRYLAALVAAPMVSSVVSAQVTSVDLSNYTRVARYGLPEPTRTAHPANNLLAQEASGITYDKDTNSLLIVGDGGTAIVQVTKTGQLIDSMTLAPGGSPQGTDFYDPEGITYVGNGMFVFTEERDQRANLVTYAPGTSITHANAQTVTLGTNVGNVGLEGLTYDPFSSSNGYVFVKEKTPEGIFQTNINFPAGTATQTSVPASNMFTPSLLGLADFADVYALSNLSSIVDVNEMTHLLVLSQESGKIVETDRAGNVLSSLTIVPDAGDAISIADMQHEGITMDGNGYIYTVCENGGGDIDHPEMWVYAPTPEPGSASLILGGWCMLAMKRRRK